MASTQPPSAPEPASPQGVAPLEGEDTAVKAKAPPKKPTSFTFLSESHPVTTWCALLVDLCEILAKRHPDTFVATALAVRGPKRQHIVTSPDGLINPAPIGTTGLWLEANQSAGSARRVVELILQAFGYSPDDFSVTIEVLS